MANLEDRTKLCINHIRTMYMAYVPDNDLIHRNCNGMNTDCENYKPVGNTVCVRQGKVAYEIEKEKR